MFKEVNVKEQRKLIALGPDTSSVHDNKNVPGWRRTRMLLSIVGSGQRSC